MKADMKMVAKLRKATGVGLMDCKNALEEAGGDYEEALKDMRKKGLAKAEKRVGRDTSAGAIVPYIHPGSQLGVLVEVNSETDFVAKGDDFKEFADDIAMQIAADADVEYVTEADIDPAWLAREREIALASPDMAGKPPEIAAKIVEGRLGKISKTKVLMERPFIKDDSITVAEYVKRTAAKFGENLRVVRFVRYALGESGSDDEEPAKEEAPAAAPEAPAAAPEADASTGPERVGF